MQLAFEEIEKPSVRDRLSRQAPELQIARLRPDLREALRQELHGSLISANALQNAVAIDPL